MAEYMADRTELTNRDLLEYWKGKVVRWPQLSLLARRYGGVDSTSCQAERNFSVLNRTAENLRSGIAVDKVEQLMLPRLNKQQIPEIALLPFVTRKLKPMPVSRHVKIQ